MKSRDSLQCHVTHYLWACTLAIGLAGAACDATAADAPGGKPATVADATRTIDLSKFPLMPKAEVQGRRRIAGLSYNVESTVAKAFEFQKQKLVAAKWKELPGTYVGEQAASAAFARDGFTLSVSAIPPGKPDLVMVSLTNHGNVDVKKLPLPKDAKSLYSGPVSTCVRHRRICGDNRRGPEQAADGTGLAAVRDGWRFAILQAKRSPPFGAGQRRAGSGRENRHRLQHRADVGRYPGPCRNSQPAIRRHDGPGVVRHCGRQG